MKQIFIKANINAKFSKYYKKMYIILSFFLFIILAIVLFKNLGNHEIVNWDEARHGVNAYEMIQNKNYIVTTYGYETDYWNLKPPLSEYFIILGYKIFGYNALGLRFFSAVAMFVCVIICFAYSYKNIGKLASIWVILGFLIINPLIFDHCARSGDADSIYILFSTVAIIGLLINNENMKGFYLSCLSFSFAFLTKSWHAGNIALIVIVYFLINSKELKINIKKILIALLFSIIPILIWGIFRFLNDGLVFFKQMITFDLLQRTSTVLEEHAGGILFYFNYITNIKAFIIFMVLICFTILSKKNNKKIFTLFISIIIPFIVFSISKTKLDWYIYCIFPSIVILSAYGIQELFELQNKKKFIIIAGIICMSTIFIYSNIKMISIDEANNSNQIFTFIHRNKEYSGKEVYLYTLSDEYKQNWEQRLLLTVELAGNLKAVNGGYNSWKKNNSAYLLVTESNIEKIEEDYEIVEKGQYYLIKHK